MAIIEFDCGEMIEYLISKLDGMPSAKLNTLFKDYLEDEKFKIRQFYLAKETWMVEVT